MNRFLPLLLALLVADLAFGAGTNPPPLTLVTPEATLNLIQYCMTAKDTQTLRRILVDSPDILKESKRNPKAIERLLLKILALADHEKDDGSFYSTLLLHGKIFRKDSRDPNELEEWARQGAIYAWLKTPDNTVRGILFFICQDQEWRWCPFFDPDSGVPAYRFELTSPKSAFQSVGGAVRKRGGLERDTFSVYEALASHQKAGVSFNAYEQAFKAKTEKRYISTADFAYESARLDEELLPADGKTLCRVWRLDETGKRTSYELFVKESDEWKWMPDPKSIWYPTKP